MGSVAKLDSHRCARMPLLAEAIKNGAYVANEGFG